MATIKALPLPTWVLVPKPDIRVKAIRAWISVEPTPVTPNFISFFICASEDVFDSVILRYRTGPRSILLMKLIFNNRILAWIASNVLAF